MNLKQTVFACSTAFLVSCSGGGSDSAGGLSADPGSSPTVKYEDIPGIGDAVGEPASVSAACGDSASPGLPSGFIRCGGEYATCTLPQASDVAYGAPGSYNIKYNVSGSIKLIDSVFGDPAYGVLREWRGVLRSLHIRPRQWKPVSVIGSLAPVGLRA